MRVRGHAREGPCGMRVKGLQCFLVLPSSGLKGRCLLYKRPQMRSLRVDIGARAQSPTSDAGSTRNPAPAKPTH